jgi:uracil-DNA glycosylase family 4
MNQSKHILVEKIQQCSSCSFRNPSIKPLPPDSEFEEVKIMFIGENPSWEEKQEVPFSPNTISGKALDKHYIKPLGLTRKQVWITDLFKCRYPKDIYKEKQKNDSLIQDVAETCSNLWLIQEIKIAKPKVIVTLSDKQVFQRLRKIFNLPIPSKFYDVGGKPHEITIDGFKTILFPMIHPDISRPLGDGDNRKKNSREKWAPLHHQKHIPVLLKLV